ncbi:MAG: hypothetical protein H7X97_03620 [Opitutaceae bacterium]|nr:hypothetical protein [Verrucomicrobiales bacterium]
MQRSQPLLSSFIKVVACAMLAVSGAANIHAADKKADVADVAGNWTWSTPGRDGGPERKSTLTLKVEGDKVTGKIAALGRDGAPTDTAIEEAKLDGAMISFKVTRTFGENKMVQKFSGKVEGSAIKGKIEFDRNGEAQSRDWEAKREAAKK